MAPKITERNLLLASFFIGIMITSFTHYYSPGFLANIMTTTFIIFISLRFLNGHVMERELLRNSFPVAFTTTCFTRFFSPNFPTGIIATYFIISLSLEVKQTDTLSIAAANASSEFCWRHQHRLESQQTDSEKRSQVLVQSL
ncbi:unnamed protein product [Zymoseptoria tritici ST99CH_3D7]|uniref:Uncharacterized protein n=1 Tax=Zymoseptoria tritici (strain ST99CH_3D7) TaxID=1276538 RepID=A0A1X7RLI9_ZYMT9|nr:unnamed protein product [Zymoseptoria tritici ST99CH_3D7]